MAELTYTPFPHCCGAGILSGFLHDAYRPDPAFAAMLRVETERLQEWFDKKNEKPGYQLWNVGMVHAILNHKQMETEPILLKYGFIRTHTTGNPNTLNAITHYVRLREPDHHIMKGNIKRVFSLARPQVPIVEPTIEPIPIPLVVNEELVKKKQVYRKTRVPSSLDVPVTLEYIAPAPPPPPVSSWDHYPLIPMSTEERAQRMRDQQRRSDEGFTQYEIGASRW